jgi:spore coat polysaccharide biosynthesis protein SpsF
MKKAGVISQVRMTSSRLPGKVLLPAKGVPLLKYHVDRLRAFGLDVIIATTTNSTDDVIAHFAEKEDIGLYRGSEENVLSRYYEAAVKYNLDTVVRVTSDCPLIDGALVKESLERYQKMNDDSIYLSNSIIRTYPRGFDTEIFSFRLLEEGYKNAVTPFEEEHVTPYIKSHSKHEHIIWAEDASAFRITVDTPEDYELVKMLIEQHNADTMGCGEIIRTLKQHPELVAINAHVEQKKV